MSWKVRKAKDGGYDIVRSDTGKKVGHSKTRAKAEASVAHRYAATEKTYGDVAREMRNSARRG